jgi:lysophospholipase L1-like esterase
VTGPGGRERRLPPSAGSRARRACTAPARVGGPSGYGESRAIAILSPFIVALTVLAVAFAVVAPAVAAPEKVAYPDSIAALGDSFTQARASRVVDQDAPENSWATGTNPAVNSIYNRILARSQAIAGHAFNDAVSGARLANLNTQVPQAIAQHADLVTILIGGNDICLAGFTGITNPVGEFHDLFAIFMAKLTAGLPDARILLASIPSVFRLWSILHGDPVAQAAWATWNWCPHMLANPTSLAPADVERRSQVEKQFAGYNAALADVCAAYVHCRFDGGALAGFAFEPRHVSLDYFHASVAGEAAAAELMWNAGFDFSDAVPPVSTASSVRVRRGRRVTLTATDAIGVAGIELKLGKTRYRRYRAPVLVRTGVTLTWRAVDVNGNIEATHTLRG